MPTGKYERKPRKRVAPTDHYRFCCETAVSRGESGVLLKVLRDTIAAKLANLNEQAKLVK
jgi:hypothetical protein